MQLLANPNVLAGSPPVSGALPPGAAQGIEPGTLTIPAQLHQLIDGYEPTPLVSLDALAAELGIGRLLVKHEAQRFGLPAFKIIGASWAIYRVLATRYHDVHGHAPPATDFAQLRDAFGEFDDLTLTTATDGNHGRAVARAASWFGIAAHIYMPAGTAAARVAAIEGEGATVTVVDGDYDLAVETAAATGGPDRLVISDTSWPGYVDIPQWIADGYSTIFGEIDTQLDANGWAPLDAFVVPVGVGALASAALAHWPSGAPDGPTRIAVEPTTADCLYRSLIAGEPVTVPGPHESMMAGMNCGTLSMIAWPAMRDRFDWCITIDDEPAAQAMVALDAAGLVVGETGAASVGALIAVAQHAPGGLAAIGLGPDSTVLCICTEGATDPVNYEAVVGHPPR